MRLHPALHNVGGLVGRAVVDDQDLGIPVALANTAGHAFQGAFDTQALVIRGNDDAQTRRRQSTVLSFFSTIELHRRTSYKEQIAAAKKREPHHTLQRLDATIAGLRFSISLTNVAGPLYTRSHAGRLQ